MSGKQGSDARRIDIVGHVPPIGRENRVQNLVQCVLGQGARNGILDNAPFAALPQPIPVDCDKKRLVFVEVAESEADHPMFPAFEI